MTIPDVTLGKQINYGNKYRFTLFNESIFQLIFYHDVRTEEKYFTPSNVRHYIGRYMYSILSDLETEPIYKANDKYEFIIQYPELDGPNYNWWRQSLSPTIQTENLTMNSTSDHYVFGYENISINYDTHDWGGLSLCSYTIKAYIDGQINTNHWNFAIGAYGAEKGIPGPLANYSNFVVLYAKINNLDMIKCITCKLSRNIFLNPTLFVYVFILM
ncbi:hypothetical protein TVAG_409630 [Trichomonas vaginalis G3]|uniref:Uncharacterized protein n=1 Tax=Trichomonas vaginalis (strain ATCC PRA-98 / G3) TaxID=412133 RepID=A2F8C3_TRIV3|nr:hypothetical protein TVAGG3_0365680 [Trichomonas vaginalis G3]EAX98825.1 hypothetical protein TVAG_409630 [Trichomonas vaginalis G3]KAI5532253.1 hypothetical protein TVAGG3_0365680 [Trichomonas vaginalis G3]|eukprot:XP_001311755.1 hypothetical protein [Trichomonas vaginalis G3]